MKKAKTNDMITLVVKSKATAQKVANPESPISYKQMLRGSAMLKKATGISLFGMEFNEHFGKVGIYNKIFTEQGVNTALLNIVAE